MPSIIEERASALIKSYNSGNIEVIMDLFAEDVKVSDFLMRAIDLDKAGTRPFFGGFVTDNENVTFYTRGVTGSREFVAHEMTIEFRSGGDIESIGIVKGQSVRLVGVSVQSWRKERRSEDDDVAGAWKIFDMKDYFFIDRGST
ncbi:Uncharacterized protein SAPIO_CDS9268 [Scedosporium apiospermum]|uniref:SnoaL-like domain-containing protein n=1 Tax=Pseudallescheria apiosperma TaxID=563466 RepID=A0A084FYP9_PSEDA|nr:Uncharacterized protein SAPIO_CDS9268 [Scedosporium apiospermum]KEZ40211.1 Uncharacterized protein SAPIO_CDS9268 [Scedosporium apiospermum]